METEDKTTNALHYLQEMQITNAVRMKIINNLTEDDKLPTDKNDQNFLIKALDGFDRSIVQRRHLEIEAEKNRNAEVTNKLVTEALLRTQIPVAAPRTQIPMLSNEYKVDDMVEGETEIGVSNLTYKEFDK